MEVINLCKKLLCFAFCMSLFISPIVTNASKSHTTLNKAAYLRSKNRPWFLGASLGWAWPSFSKNSTSILNGSNQPSPSNSDRYSIRSPSSTSNWTIFTGYRWSRKATWLPFYSLALQYQHLSRFKTQGTIEQYSLSNFTNYSYRMYGQADIFSLQSKADIYQYRSYLPYITLGLGVACNNLTGYGETPTSGITPRENPNFKAKTTNNFAYTFGLGIDYLLQPSLILSLGYEYANLGDAKTGYGKASSWSNDLLKFGRLSSSTVMLSASYQLPIR